MQEKWNDQSNAEESMYYSIIVMTNAMWLKLNIQRKTQVFEA